MTFEETVRSALRWHSSFVADAAKYKFISGQQDYNKKIVDSEEDSLKQIMEAYRAELAKAKGGQP